MSTFNPAARDFSAKTRNALAKRGIALVGVQALPGSGQMPWANAERGYVVNDNGCGKVWTFRQVMGASK